MSDITEGLGSAIDGTMTSRTVEPDHGKNAASHGTAGGEACLNCGAIPKGEFCQQCGQKTGLHRTLTAIGHDLMHGVLHLDGKLWRTLPLLAFRPGKLTRRYIDGERAKFVSPMAMFLFSVFLMFALFQALGISAPADLQAEAQAQVEHELDTESQRINEELAAIETSLEAEETTLGQMAELEARKIVLQDELARLNTRADNIGEWLTSSGSAALDDVQSNAQLNLDDARTRLKSMEEGSPEYADLAAEIAFAEQGMTEIENFEQQATESAGDINLDASQFDLDSTGIPLIDETVQKWRTNPSLMLYKLQTNAYKFSWLLIPLSIPFVWLPFAWKRRFKAYDHAIFVTYSIAFMSLLFIGLSVLSVLGVAEGWVFVALAIVPPIHIYKQLRHTYELSRFGALWRLAFLLTAVFIIIALFIQLLLVLGAF